MTEARNAAFVRNIMIGREGLHRVRLLDLFAAAGAADPVSHISTGNVAFTLEPAAVPALVEEVEAGIAAIIGRYEPVYVRSLDDLAELTARDPFEEIAEIDACDRLVTFAREPVAWPEPLPTFSRRRDWVVFRVDPTEIYSATILVDGRTQAPGGRIEKLVGQRITTRAWGTVLQVVDKEG